MGSVEGLDLGLLVDGKDHRMLGRVEVEADDVVDLLDAVLVLTDLERADEVRLESVTLPYPTDGRGAESGGLGESASGPMGRAGRALVQGRAEDEVEGGNGEGGETTGSRSVGLDSVEPVESVPLPPQRHGVGLGMQFPGDVEAPLSLRRPEEDAGP